MKLASHPHFPRAWCGDSGRASHVQKQLCMESSARYERYILVWHKIYRTIYRSQVSAYSTARAVAPYLRARTQTNTRLSPLSRSMRILPIGCVIATALAASRVSAQTVTTRDTAASLPTVTVTATRTPASILTTPLAITKITARDLRSMNGYGLEEAL